MQKFKFPMEYLRVTQGELDSHSHAGSLAMDFGGKDTGADRLYCPCDMVVKRCRHNANGELYLESTLPVEFADGTTDYARLICLHDGTFNVVEGQVLKQGDYFYDEGGMGSGNPKAFGTHVHMEAGKGKWNSTTQSPNAQGTYVIENQSHLYDLFILGDDVVKMTDPETGEVLDGGYPWKRESDLEKAAAEGERIYGVDVSHNRSENIMSKVKANGKADFAILRAVIGSESEDRNLKQYIKDSKGMKLGFFAANYFGNNADAVLEADFLIDTIEQYGFAPDALKLPVFCDWEYFSHEYWKKQGVEITPAQLREMTEAFCGRIIERGYRTGVYVNKDFYENWYGDEFFRKHPEYHVWYARPGMDKPDRDCYIWQYACNNGAEYGVNEDLDKNILLGEYVTGADTDIGNEDNVMAAENEKLKNELAILKTELTQAKVDTAKLTEENRFLKDILDKIEKLVEEIK